MKIHIVGPSGSGKTFFSKALGAKFAIPTYALDDLFWDHSAGSYTQKRDETERNRMLQEIVIRDNWVIEGVQHTWTGESFDRADIIYCLETPPWLCRLRILRRFLKGKLRHNGGKKETIASVIRLLKWTKKFYRVNFPEIRMILAQYKEKVVYIRSKSQMQKYISEKKRM